MNDRKKQQRLVSKAQLRRLGKRSDRRGLIQLALHVALIVALGLLVQRFSDSSLWVLFILLYGIPLIFLFSALHESIHNTAFRSRWINEWIAAACGFLLFLPAGYFRLFHYQHHRYTQLPGKDPELALDKPASRRGFWCHISGLPLWWGSIRMLFSYARGRVDEEFVREQHKEAVIVEARIHLGLYVCLLAGSLMTANSLLWWYWILPLLLTQPLLRLYLLAEHHGCDWGDEMLCNSRTTQTFALLRLLSWNMSYHVEHHCLPSIPFHVLPELHELIRNRVKFQQPGYVALMRDIYRDLPST